MSRQPIVRVLPPGVQILTVVAHELQHGDQIVNDKDTVIVESVHLNSYERTAHYTGRIVRGTGRRKAPYSWSPLWNQEYTIERGHR